MSRLSPHYLVGMFILLTITLAGAAIGRLLGMSASEGAYLTLLALAAVGWLVGRQTFRQGS